MSKKQKKVQHIPQILQESIPYERVFAEGGLIEVELTDEALDDIADMLIYSRIGK